MAALPAPQCPPGTDTSFNPPGPEAIADLTACALERGQPAAPPHFPPGRLGTPWCSLHCAGGASPALGLPLRGHIVPAWAGAPIAAARGPLAPLRLGHTHLSYWGHSGVQKGLIPPSLPAGQDVAVTPQTSQSQKTEVESLLCWAEGLGLPAPNWGAPPQSYADPMAPPHPAAWAPLSGSCCAGPAPAAGGLQAPAGLGQDV